MMVMFQIYRVFQMKPKLKSNCSNLNALALKEFKYLCKVRLFCLGKFSKSLRKSCWIISFEF